MRVYVCLHMWNACEAEGCIKFPNPKMLLCITLLDFGIPFVIKTAQQRISLRQYIMAEKNVNSFLLVILATINDLILARALYIL